MLPAAREVGMIALTNVYITCLASILSFQSRFVPPSRSCTLSARIISFRGWGSIELMK
uniref:Uncharacterized protein n=1 Tax=Utricularia reniformis TaxID=192314 RepID=A0A1Y0B3I1_9LAMI|nr:hypothetical protein AEK19_MT1787 [Utricularia reniformis]ART31960.1 hypothetical protein AEK19_MT1787 [Utricularia reniformis]